MMVKHVTLSLGLSAIALTLSGAAMAGVHVGLNIGFRRLCTSCRPLMCKCRSWRALD
jgi:hypothetical protein